jgi:Novel STAND NTPase 1
MNSTHTRYPGAQPFSDDDFSRRVFFGREQASITLTDQVLANRLVVVYAKSGLGKTSLLNAGVAPRLRDEGYLPLIVRVNDVQQGALVSVLEGIRAEAERKRVEYVQGLPDSLWSFFKTAEFWRGDLLLTPVLILDQFEELFTLQSEQQRTSFLTDLSYLVRGVRPPVSAQTVGSLDENSPTMRIVLSLREDYLGFLEEAADHIPQILDHRFRLAPLTLDAASEAMTGPAAIDDSVLETKPFSYDPETVTTILNHLSHRRTEAVARVTRYVEPFQLQLICQRVERIVAELQLQLPTNLTLTMADIGGEVALEETLRACLRSWYASQPTDHQVNHRDADHDFAGLC